MQTHLVLVDKAPDPSGHFTGKEDHQAGEELGRQYRAGREGGERQGQSRLPGPQSSSSLAFHRRHAQGAMRVHRGQAVAGDEPRGPGLRLGLTGRCRTVCHHPQKALEHGWLKGRMRAGAHWGWEVQGGSAARRVHAPGPPSCPLSPSPCGKKARAGLPNWRHWHRCTQPTPQAGQAPDPLPGCSCPSAGHLRLAWDRDSLPIRSVVLLKRKMAIFEL